MFFYPTDLRPPGRAMPSLQVLSVWSHRNRSEDSVHDRINSEPVVTLCAQVPALSVTIKVLVCLSVVRQRQIHKGPL